MTSESRCGHLSERILKRKVPMEISFPHLIVGTLFLKFQFEKTSQQLFEEYQLAHFLIDLRPWPDACAKIDHFLCFWKLGSPRSLQTTLRERRGLSTRERTGFVADQQTKNDCICLGKPRTRLLSRFGI